MGDRRIALVRRMRVRPSDLTLIALHALPVFGFCIPTVRCSRCAWRSGRKLLCTESVSARRMCPAGLPSDSTRAAERRTRAVAATRETRRVATTGCGTNMLDKSLANRHENAEDSFYSTPTEVWRGRISDGLRNAATTGRAAGSPPPFGGQGAG